MAVPRPCLTHNHGVVEYAIIDVSLTTGRPCLAGGIAAIKVTRKDAWLVLHPRGPALFVRQLHALLGEDATNLGREMARLAQMGVLVTTTEGGRKYYQANPRPQNSPVGSFAFLP
jgi:hypothetical protein